MGYMTRRIEHLLELRAADKLRISDAFAQTEAGQQLVNDLQAIRYHPDARVDLSSCSPLVKSIAKATFSLDHYDLVDGTSSEAQGAQPANPKQARVAMMEYFDLLEGFFHKATGREPGEFDFEEYRSAVLAGDHRISEAARLAYEEYPPKIAKFHARNTRMLYDAARAIGGLKVVLGGSSRFPPAAFNGVRKMALYADTILIPDPLLPWLEVHRAEERFPLIEFLNNAHQLLLLKPLVNADIPFPAILVFPSWEKSFELNDVQAKDGISQLILGFFSAYLGIPFDDETELAQYVQGRGRQHFQDVVTAKELFWPPEEDGPAAFAPALASYQQWLQQWRSTDWLSTMSSLSPEALALNAIWERLTPHYHVRDNAAAMHAQPMYWLAPHFHYYKLISSAANLGELTGSSSLSTLQGLLSPRIAWLGNIPVPDLARLREEDANEKFRARLHSYLDELGSSNADNLEEVVSSIGRGLESLLSEHDREARLLAEALDRRLIHTLGASVLTTAVAMYPWLDAWLGLAILGPPLKAAYHLLEYAHGRSVLSRSLIGVLSEARARSNKGQAA